MKPQRFKPGQEVVCIKKEKFKTIREGTLPDLGDPKFNEQCTVISYYCFYKGQWRIKLVGYPNNAYGEKYFQPLVEDAVLEKELSSITETTTV